VPTRASSFLAFFGDFFLFFLDFLLEIVSVVLSFENVTGGIEKLSWSEFWFGLTSIRFVPLQHSPLNRAPAAFVAVIPIGNSHPLCSFSLPSRAHPIGQRERWRQKRSLDMAIS
jgi:hypothetical protein